MRSTEWAACRRGEEERGGRCAERSGRWKWDAVLSPSVGARRCPPSITAGDRPPLLLLLRLPTSHLFFYPLSLRTIDVRAHPPFVVPSHPPVPTDYCGACLVLGVL